MKGNARSLRSLLVAALVAASVLAPGTAQADHRSCHDGNPSGTSPLTTNLTLEADIIDCDQNGVRVGKSGLTIDLNGHIIDGTFGGKGIWTDGYDNIKIIGPGTIREFATGILSDDSNGTSVSGVEVTNNINQATGGIVVTRRGFGSKKDLSNGVTIKNNEVTLNSGSGILVHRSAKGVKITDNTVEDNGGDGIFVGGAGEIEDLGGSPVPDSAAEEIAVSDVTIKGNDVTSNDITGIGVTGEPAKSITITDNTSSENGSPDTGDADAGHEGREDDDFGGHGIKVAGDISDITIKNNTANLNGPGAICSERNGAGILVAGSGSGVSISGNTTDDNAMSGVFTAGELNGVSIKNGPSTDGNGLNCDDQTGAVQVVGAMKKVNVSGNDAITNNLANGIKFGGHANGLTIANNDVSDNGSDGADSRDTAGILIAGRMLNLKLTGNTVSNNENPGTQAGHGVDIRGSVRRVGKAKQAVNISKNTASDNDEHGIGVRVEASVPIPCGGTTPDCPSPGAKVGDPNPESADDDCNNDANNTPAPGGGCTDETLNSVKNVLVKGNTTNNNGTDGILAITDLTLANNTANNNTGFGIEHNSDPTVRGGEASDGPHLLADGGGNSASGNGTDCSAGLTC